MDDHRYQKDTENQIEEENKGEEIYDYEGDDVTGNPVASPKGNYSVDEESYRENPDA